MVDRPVRDRKQPQTAADFTKSMPKVQTTLRLDKGGSPGQKTPPGLEERLFRLFAEIDVLSVFFSAAEPAEPATANTATAMADRPLWNKKKTQTAADFTASLPT